MLLLTSAAASDAWGSDRSDEETVSGMTSTEGSTYFSLRTSSLNFNYFCSNESTWSRCVLLLTSAMASAAFLISQLIFKEAASGMPSMEGSTYFSLRTSSFNGYNIYILSIN